MSKVTPLATIEAMERKTVGLSILNNIPNNEIEEQKIRNSENEKRRRDYFTKILRNEENYAYSQFVGLYGLGGIVLGTLLNSVTALIPVHDVIKNPEYFYEGVLTEVFFTLYLGTAFVFYASYLLKVDCIRNFTKCAKVSIGLVAFRLCIEGALNIYWIVVQGNRYPMPFHTLIIGIAIYSARFALIWYQFPEEWRKSSEFRKRYGFYMLRAVVFILFHIEYTIFKKIMLEINSTWQWIVPALLISVKEMNIWITSKLSIKAAGTKDTSTQVVNFFEVNCIHCVILSTFLGANITYTAAWTILLGDLLLNFYLTARIIWIKNGEHFSRRMEKVESMLVSLVLNELVEALVPVTFCICLLLSYYGPNAELMCDIKSSHFHCTPIENIGKYVENLGFFFLADIISLIITGLFLWFFARINIYQAYTCLQKEFGTIMTLTVATWILIVRVILKQ